MTVRFLELRITTSAPDEQREFYDRTLGLPVTRAGNGGFAVEVGSTRLAFEPREDRAASRHFAINVPANQFEHAKRWAGERAELLPGPDGSDELDFSNWDARALYFLDVDENVVELIARYRLDNATDAPFGPRSLLEVSEIGMPTPDVGTTVSFLERALDLPFFDGDRKTFSALGDDRGLFIVVSADRDWFPTAQRSGIDPAEVTVAAEREAELSVPRLPYRIRAVRA